LKGFKQITPRGVLRRQTNTPHIKASPRVKKVLIRGETGNMDWVPKTKTKFGQNFKIKKTYNSEISDDQGLHDTQSEPQDFQQNKDWFMTNDEGSSPSNLPLSMKRNGKLMKLSKNRWALRRKRRTKNEGEIHNLLHNIEEKTVNNSKSEDEDFSHNKAKRLISRHRKSKDKSMKRGKI